MNEAFRGVHCLKIHDSQISTCKSSSPYPSFGPRSESSKAFSISSFRSYASSLSLSSDLVKGVHACGRRAAKPRFTPSVARVARVSRTFRSKDFTKKKRETACSLFRSRNAQVARNNEAYGPLNKALLL